MAPQLRYVRSTGIGVRLDARKPASAHWTTLLSNDKKEVFVHPFQTKMLNVDDYVLISVILLPFSVPNVDSHIKHWLNCQSMLDGLAQDLLLTRQSLWLFRVVTLVHSGWKRIAVSSGSQ